MIIDNIWLGERKKKKDYAIETFFLYLFIYLFWKALIHKNIIYWIKIDIVFYFYFFKAKIQL